MIYLHIGLPKSGSSAIQVYLNDNNVELKKLNVLYPWPHKYRQLFKTSAGNGKKISLVFKNGMKEKEINTIKDELYNYDKKYDKVIISSEGLSTNFKDPSQLKRFIPENSEYKIVLYVRNQVDKFVSDTNQTIKNALREDYNISERWFEFNNYYELLERWSDVFGKDNIIAKVYDRDLFKDGDLIKDFCSVLDMQYLDTPQNDIINPSLDYNYLEIMRIVNHYAKKENDMKIKKIIKDIAWKCSAENKKTKIDGKTPIPFPESILKDIANRLSSSNKLLSDKYNLTHIDLDKSINKYIYLKPEINHDALWCILKAINPVLKKKLMDKGKNYE